MTPFKRPKLQFGESEPQIQSVGSLWGDDSDDELILMASQAVEQEDNAGPKAAESVHDTTNGFRNFIQEFENGSSSTQASDLVSLNVKANIKVNSRLIQHQNRTSEDYLKRRIASLENEKETVAKDNQSKEEQLQINNYEISRLRHELKEKEHTNNELRVKLVKNEESRRHQLQHEVTDLRKQLSKCESELGLRRLESVKLKSERQMIFSKGNEMDANTSLRQDQDDRCRFTWDIECPLNFYHASVNSSWDLQYLQSILESIQDSLTNNTEKCTIEMLRGINHLISTATINRSHFDKLVHLIRQSLAANFGQTMHQTKVKKRHNTRTQLLVQNPTDCPDNGSKPSTKINPSWPIIRKIAMIFVKVCKINPKFHQAFIANQFHIQLWHCITPFLTNDSIAVPKREVFRVATTMLQAFSNEDQLSWSIDAYRQICFSQLEAETLCCLVEALQKINDRVPEFSEHLCHYTEANSQTFSILMGQNVAQFVPGSQCCVLQVLGAALEAAFPMDIQSYTCERYKCLLATSLNVMRFYRDAIANRSKWLVPKVLSDGEMDSKACHCYVKMTTSVIILLYLSLRAYTPTVQRKLQLSRAYMNVVQIGVLLLNDILATNLQMRLLYLIGRPIKNRLIYIYNELIKCNALFNFRLAQVKALDTFELELISSTLEKPEERACNQHIEQGVELWTKLDVF